MRHGVLARWWCLGPRDAPTMYTRQVRGNGLGRLYLPLGGEADRDVYSGGAGFRYLLARVLGLQAGLDFAWSSEGDHAFYIVVGNVWR